MEYNREPEATGWNAIDEALRNIYGDIEPKHWGTIIPYYLGGRDPLTGLSAYLNPTHSDHWHYITYGFSELFQKEWDDPNVSGFGFELTLRLAKTSEEDSSTWVFNFLQNLARYVFNTGRQFGRGHTMPLNGPIRSEYDTAIHAITFESDPQLPPINTANGAVHFLQVVGITNDELAAIHSWNAQAFLELVARQNPFLVTDIDRPSYLNDVRFAEEVETRSAVDGASCGELCSGEFSFGRTTFLRTCKLRLGALLVDSLTARLCGRIPYGRPMLLTDGQEVVEFAPNERNSWSLHDGILQINLTAETAALLRKSVPPRAGKYRIPGLPRLEIEVTTTDIRDNEGNITAVLG